MPFFDTHHLHFTQTDKLLSVSRVGQYSVLSLSLDRLLDIFDTHVRNGFVQLLLVQFSHTLQPHAIASPSIQHIRR